MKVSLQWDAGNWRTFPIRKLGLGPGKVSILGPLLDPRKYNARILAVRIAAPLAIAVTVSNESILGVESRAQLSFSAFM